MSFKSSFPTPAVAAISLGLIGGTIPAPAYADLGDQLFKLLPEEPEQGHRFGVSVAISGTIVIVGELFGHDDNGTSSGSAYLFDTTTGQQIAKLFPDDGADSDRFGSSVAIRGATAIVGAYADDDNGDASGSVYLFDISDPARPTQIAKVLPDDGAAGNIFGYSVAISGTTVIVGAYHDDDNGVLSGSAYLFDISDPARPTQIAKLLPNDGAAEDEFGRSVAISGAIAIVGASLNDDNGTHSGSAYLFDATTGRQIFKLLANDGAAEDHLGSRVAISGATAIVSAGGDDDNGTGSGSAYLFDTTTGQQIAKLLADDGASGDHFGDPAISGAIAIVGADGDDDNGNASGSAYLFDISDPKNPVQIAKLLANDGATEDVFGDVVAISGPPGKETAIVGVYRDGDYGKDSGSAYLFDAAVPGTCPWDLDANGSVGASDLLSLLVSWGPCKGCPADFDGNGTVGASDLLALLVNWGPCP